MFMGVFTLIVKKTQPTFTGINFWIYSSILIACGYILMAQRNSLPDVFSIIFAQLMFVTAGFFRIFGLNNFFYIRNTSKFLFCAILIIIIFILVQVFFTFFNESVLTRTISSGVVLSGISIYIGILILQNKPSTNTSTYYLASVSFFTFSFIFLLRIVQWLIIPEVRGLFNPDFINNLQFVSSLIIDIVWTTMFFVLHNQRINNQRQESEGSLRELNAGKDRFLSILAHDLKNIFNSIYNLSELLLLKFETISKKELEHHIKVMFDTTSRAYFLFEDLLFWSASNLGKLTPNIQKIAFKDLYNRVIEKLSIKSNQKNIMVTLIEKNESVEIYTDPNMMQAILRNLLSNALKYTNQNGKVEVIIEQADNYAIISISDNGTGISKSDQVKLWDSLPGYSTTGTANEQGTGFGLILCKEFVEKLGGRIWVESELKIGSTFRFTIPVGNGR